MQLQVLVDSIADHVLCFSFLSFAIKNKNNYLIMGSSVIKKAAFFYSVGGARVLDGKKNSRLSSFFLSLLLFICK